MIADPDRFLAAYTPQTARANDIHRVIFGTFN